MKDVVRGLGILLFGVSGAAAEGGGSIEFLRKYRLLNLIPGIGAFVLFPMGVMAYAHGYRTVAAFNLIVSGYLVLAIGYVRRTGREQGAVLVGIALVTVYFYYLFATGGTFHSGHVWFPLLPLIAFFLLGSRRGIAAASLGLLLLLCHPVLVVLFDSPVVYPGNFMVRYVVFYLVVSLFAFSFERAREISQANLEATNRDLTGAVVEIQQAKDTAEAANEAKELLLKRVRLQAQTLGRLATDPVLHAGEMQAAFRVITEVVADALGVARAGVWLYTAGRDEIECRDLFLREERRHSAGQRLRAGEYPAYFAALAAERTIAAVDAHRDVRTAEFSTPYLTPQGITSMLDATLRGGDEIIGVLRCEHVGAPRVWSPDELNFVGSVADLVALTLQARERRQAREQLLAAMKRAEAANEAKSRFLANMSHEIRTPLNGILGLAELLEGAALTDRQQGFVRDIRGSGEHLLSLISDILDFSKIEAGKMRLESVPVDLSAEVRRVVEHFADQARRKGLALRCEIPAPFPAGLCGDPLRLRQVLVNLVGNAVKFTGRGEVTIRLLQEAEDAGAVQPRLEVRDTGVGIPAALQSAIFDVFAQADESTTRTFGGTGLGLTICRELVEMMGGRIGVESREGEGSTFWFTARLAKGPVCAMGPAAASAPAPAAVGGRPQFPGRVLLAEDNRVNREVAAGMLALFGPEVVVAGNGREAVEAWRSGGFDLVLMDCQMPEMDGYEATRRIRAEEAGGVHGGRRTPIVALTANALAGDRDLSLAAGMDDHLGKPFRIPQLEAVLQRWLRPAGARRPV